MSRSMSIELDDSGHSSPLNNEEFFKEGEKETRIFDAIHNCYIRVPPLCRLIIDTPQFDRYNGLIFVKYNKWQKPSHIQWIDTLL